MIKLLQVTSRLSNVAQLAPSACLLAAAFSSLGVARSSSDIINFYDNYNYDCLTTPTSKDGRALLQDHSKLVTCLCYR